MKPLYVQLMDHILEKIQSGEWTEGHMIPTEAEFGQTFHMSRQTVRTALLHLVNDGYLSRTKGKGTFVTKPKVIESTTMFLESFSQEMHRKGCEVKTEVLELRSVVPPQEVAERLGTAPGEAVIKLKRLRYQKGDFKEGAIVLTTSWYSEAFSYLLKYDFEQRSVHDILKENGVTRKQVEKNINVRILNDKECHMMGIEEDSMSVFIWSQAYDQKDKLIEYTESLYPAERNEFIIKIRF